MDTEGYGIFFYHIYICTWGREWISLESACSRWTTEHQEGPKQILCKIWSLTQCVGQTIGSESEFKQPHWRTAVVTASAQHSGPPKPLMRTWLRPRCLHTLCGRELSDLGLFLCVPQPFNVRNRECKRNQELPASKLPCGFPSMLRVSQSPSNFQTVRVLPLSHGTLSLCPFSFRICDSPPGDSTPSTLSTPIFLGQSGHTALEPWNLEVYLPGRVSPDIHRVFFLTSSSSHSNAPWSEVLPGQPMEKCTPSPDIILELCFL